MTRIHTLCRTNGLNRGKHELLRPELFALGLVVLGFALRAYHLDYQSLWRDEIDSINFARRSIPEIVRTFAKRGENGPLYFLPLHFWLILSGGSEYALRFFSAIFGAASVPLIYRLGKALFDGRVGLAGAFFACLSPYYIWYSQEAKMYALVVALTVATSHSYLNALEKGGFRHWAGFVVLASLSLYTHIFAVLLVGFEVAFFLLFFRRYRGRWRAWIISMALLTLPYIPLALWEVPTLLAPPPTSYRYYPLGDILHILFIRFSSPIDHPVALPFVVLFLFLFLAGLFLPRFASSEATSASLGHPYTPRERGFLALYILIPAAAFLVISWRIPLFLDRYMIIVSPAYYLVLGLGVVRVGERARALGPVVLLLVALAWIPPVLAQPLLKAGLRWAGQYYAQRIGPDEPAVFVSPFVRRYLTYYYKGGMNYKELPSPNSGATLQDLEREIQRLAEGEASRRLWLVLCEEHYWDKEGLIRAWFQENAELLEEAAWPQITIRHYRIPAPSVPLAANHALPTTPARN